jgi:putative ABC transport system permease protein
MIEYFFCAIRNLGRKKLRTFLTVSGIAIGVASVIIIGAIGQGGRNAVADELDSLGINGLNISTKSDVTSSSHTSINDGDVQTCLSVKGVKSAMPVIMQSGTAILHGTDKSALFWGVGSDASSIISIKLLHGKMLSKTDISDHAKVCLVDDTFAYSFFKRLNVTGEKLTVYMGSSYQQLEIKGVVANGSSILYNLVGSYMPSFIYMPYTTAEDLRGFSGYDEIAIKTASNDDIDTVGQKIVNVLSDNAGNDTFVASNMFKQKQRLSDLLNIVTLIISAVGSISLIVAGLGIMTVMTVSVSERTREIGIKKAIGAKKKVIMMEFLFEALAISLLGAIIGITVGSLISLIASQLMHFGFTIRIGSIMLSSGFAVLIGVMFGVYPAIKAACLKPVDALRHE